MIQACLWLVPIALGIALPLTWLVREASRRVGAIDSAGVAGQQKTRRFVPNTGGVAIFWAVVLPMVGGLLAVAFAPGLVREWVPAAAEHLDGIRSQTGLAAKLLGSMAILHVMGLIDDRRPLGPFLKLGLMAAPALFIVAGSDTRMLTLLDARVGGPWLSIALTVVWFLVVTNAMNFMDNMDGLSGGVGAIAAGCLLAIALLHGQWFVAGCLALLVGALLGFLWFNFPWRRWEATNGETALRRPSASIFMGDGGSVVLGFLLAFLTVRLTYVTPPGGAGGVREPGWYGVFIPLLVLAVPLYDFASVVSIRLSQGRSPFVGDQQHLSHRTVRRGLSRRATVVFIYFITAATGLSAVPLATLAPWQAALVGVQGVLLVSALALFEWSAREQSEESGGGS